MMQQTFWNVLERRLLVGGEKRQEILTELRQHFDVAGSVSTMGDPELLARRYNRVHTGVLSSLSRLYGTIIASLLVLWALSWLRYPVPNEFVLINHTAFFLSSMFGAVRGLSFVVLVVLVGSAVTRMRRMWWHVFATAMTALAVSVLTTLLTSGGSADMMFPVITVGVMTVLGLLASVFVSPLPRLRSRIQTIGRVAAESLLGIALGTVIFFIATMFTEGTLAPYDLYPAWARPPHGTFIRAFNDFFESGAGAWGVAVLATGAFFVFVLYRERRIVLTSRSGEAASYITPAFRSRRKKYKK